MAELDQRRIAPTAVVSDGHELTPVAQYIRMSTEHQQYSHENQSRLISEYAFRNRMRVVRTYADLGKSGLELKGRTAMQRLLQDVGQPHVPFDAILVCDVSRWGRFQDPDEAAACELTCKRRGIRVVYCAEPFANDGSISSSVLIGLKRSMAAEYSRELSARVFAGACNIAKKGYAQGGVAGFGLRRIVVDEAGQVRGTLSVGERKSIQAHRVLLQPGSDAEVAAVRLVFHLFIDKHRTRSEIARILNARGVPWVRGHPWRMEAVHAVLTNERYAGTAIYNRKSGKLKAPIRENARELWVRKEGAYEPVIPMPRFLRAQQIIRDAAKRLDREEMLKGASQLFAEHGLLSAAILARSKDVPSVCSYIRIFGSLTKLYDLVGYQLPQNRSFEQVNRALKERGREFVSDVQAGLIARGSSCVLGSEAGRLIVNDELTIQLIVAPNRGSARGYYQWRIHMPSVLPDIVLVVRMDISNAGVQDYYLLPSMDMPTSRLPRLARNGRSLDVYRMKSLEPLYALAARAPLSEQRS
jgi:DNA invertase Pin-like site-specific DNA recombinase